MPRPRQDAVPSRASTRFALALAVGAGGAFSFLDNTLPTAARVATAIMTVLAVVLWVAYEVMKPERGAPPQPTQAPNKAPPEAAVVRWLLLAALLVIEWALLNPGPPAILSMLFANIATRTQPARTWKLRGAVTLASLLTLLAFGRAMLLSFTAGMHHADVANTPQMIAMMVCVCAAVLVPTLAGRIATGMYARRAATAA